MPSLSVDRFYATEDGPPAQGDILLGSVARIVHTDDRAPSRWQVLDEYIAELAPAMGPFPSLRVAGSRSIVMVTIHDCGQDKEFNAVVSRLLAAQGIDDQDHDAVAGVVEQVEADDTLDRSIQVSPLLDPATVEVAGRQVDQSLLLGGRMVGYLPVPPLVVDGTVIVPASVVDLNYRTTLDRLTYVQRLSSLSEEARQQLRYALARLDVVRTPTLESELADAVGQEVRSAKVDKRNPLVVKLVLADGSTLELMQRPGSPPAGPISRSRRSIP